MDRNRRVFIINFKNYREILGEGAARLVAAAENVANKSEVEIIVAPPVPMLYSVTSKTKLPVFSQKVENREEGKSTGSVIPEALKEIGCAGSLLNHSESRLPRVAMVEVIPRMKGLGLSTCLCAEGPAEVSSFAGLGSEFLAVEPPELIGTGIAVSKAKPDVVLSSVRAASEQFYPGRLLCGAGIVSGEDVRAAVKLGAEGILVASSVVKAKDDWQRKIQELASALL